MQYQRTLDAAAGNVGMALRITLETHKSNYQSHQLYEKMGFVKDQEFQTFHCFLK